MLGNFLLTLFKIEYSVWWHAGFIHCQSQWVCRPKWTLHCPTLYCNLGLFYLINHTVWLYWPISYYIMQGITNNKWQMIEIWYFEWPETLLYNIIRFLWPFFLHQAFTDHPTTSVAFLFIGWTLSTALGKKQILSCASASTSLRANICCQVCFLFIFIYLLTVLNGTNSPKMYTGCDVFYWPST